MIKDLQEDFMKHEAFEIRVDRKFSHDKDFEVLHHIKRLSSGDGEALHQSNGNGRSPSSPSLYASPVESNFSDSHMSNWCIVHLLCTRCTEDGTGNRTDKGSVLAHLPVWWEMEQFHTEISSTVKT
ncbi:hypothetical protein H920_08341 [Fukomys damarensis]|uniref:Uncharacterized protein n=1 Tax=Fukomys damarensis TaxID=885580 RepID=A0A091DIC6_FUKDA|nr:hypothetical protein H920_08341 [Fukomys damarensis]